MAIDVDVRKYLLSKSTVTAIIGTRLFPDYIPQRNEIYPCGVYQIISSLPQHTLSGGQGYCETRIQIDIYAKTEVERNSGADAIRDEMQGFPTTAPSSGNMGTATVSAVSALVSRNLYEPDQDNADTGLFRNSSDYWIRHDQTVPTYAA